MNQDPAFAASAGPRALPPKGEVRFISANGLRFAYLSRGDAGKPLAIMVHGFPDNAEGWLHQMVALAAAGFHVVAPYMRGYAPTQIPANDAKNFTPALAAQDISELIRALGATKATVIGHDWGAAITYKVLERYPEQVEKAVAIGIPPAKLAFQQATTSLQGFLRAWHWFAFQLPKLPEALLSWRDFRLVDHFWEEWSDQPVDKAHVESIKAALRGSQGESGNPMVSALVNYYRGGLYERRAQQRGDGAQRKVAVPTLAIYGANDLRSALAAKTASWFEPHCYEWKIIPNADHFVQLDQPDATNAAILAFLTARP